MTREERVRDFYKEIEVFETNFPDADIQSLVTNNKPFWYFLLKEGFFTSPASTKYHGAYDGGLYDHSKAVYKRLRKLTVMNDLKWQRPESPFIVGMFHDLCKIDQYKLVETKTQNVLGQEVTLEDAHYEYNDRTLLKGHGAKSVMLLSQFLTLTEEELLCIRYHMGAYEKEEWSELDMAIKKYENVFWTHAADMLASKVDGV